MKIHPAMASKAATLLNPAAQKSSSDATSPWSESVRVRPSVRCITGPRISFTHPMTAIMSNTAANTPKTFAASTTVSTPESAVPTVREDRWRQGIGQVDRLRFGRHGLQTIPTGKIVVNQSGFGARCVLSELQGRPLTAQPICFFHYQSPREREHWSVSLSQGARLRSQVISPCSTFQCEPCMRTRQMAVLGRRLSFRR